MKDRLNMKYEVIKWYSFIFIFVFLGNLVTDGVNGNKIIEIVKKL